MKNNIRLISLFLCMALICSANVYAWSTKNDDLFDDDEPDVFGTRSSRDLFYDDFTSTVPGSAPQDYEVSANGCIVTVESTDTGAGSEKNCLLLHDNRNGGSTEFIGPKVVRRFEKQTGVFALEYRFKTEQLASDIAPLNVQIRQDNSVMCSIMAASGDGILRISDEAVLGNVKFPYGVWFTVRVVVDTEKHKLDIRLQSEHLKGNPENIHPRAEHNKKLGTVTLSDVPAADDFVGDGINNIVFSTQRWEGKQYFDYVKVETGAERMKTNVPELVIEAPVAENPQTVPSGRYINLYHNGKYHFWSNTPFSVNSRMVVPLENYTELLGIEYTCQSGDITMTHNGMQIRMSVGKTEAYADGIPSYVETSPVEKFGTVYIPVRFVSETFGYTVGWVPETATVTLAKKEVQ